MTTGAPKVWLTTLGCAKNQVDSDKLTALLGESGYAGATAPDDADVVMVNTCAFIEEARRESIDTILEVEAARRPGARLVVLGCLAQRFGTQLADALPEVDAVLGLDRYGDLVGTLDRFTGRQTVRPPTSGMDILYSVRRPAPDTPYAYVKVAEGCDKGCSFCAIPLIRGPQRSRPPGNIRDEIAGLVESGVAEVVLVAQDLAAYGRDIAAPGGLVDLVRFVSDVEGLRRLRLLYLHPRETRPDLIEEVAANPVVARYFDLSLQHASGRLLRAMRRPGDGGDHLDLIARIREAVPGAATRSSFIVGFPGETDGDVEELATFLGEAGLDWAGFFGYSPEEGTPAAALRERVGEAETAERLRYLEGIQHDLTARASAARIGDVVEVVVDGIEDGKPFGRSYREAPEIDGVIQLDRGEPGDWVTAEIDAAYEADLVATVVGSPS